MAKYQSINGRLRGALHNVVYRRNSQDVRTDIAAVRPTSVKNPKTTAQASQRMKLAPAQSFYRVMKELLDHSWEGVKYGASSYSYFLKKAMLMQNGPYVPKGTNLFLPARYPVSEGSLAGVQVDDITENSIRTDLFLGTTSLSATLTFGELSQAIIANNSHFRNGDQITFIEFRQRTDGRIYPIWNRWILDTASDDVISYETIDERAQNFSFYGVTIRTFDDATDTTKKFLGYREENDYHMSIVGAAVIQSRKSGTSWLRSSSVVTLTDAYAELIYGEDAAELAINSYTSDSVNSIISSEWYLNQGTQQAYAGQLFTQAVTINGAQVYVIAALVDMNGRVRTVYFTDNGARDGKLIAAATGEAIAGTVAYEIVGKGNSYDKWDSTYYEQLPANSKN